VTERDADSLRALEARITELESRVAFQEQALADMSDALAQSRLEASRNADLLRRVLDELAQPRAAPYADAADEPPPPHY
jgi:SlyX protein